jgi:hypothetical protein
MFEDREQIDSTRILCFYRLDIDQTGIFSPLDERMKCFGDSFAFVDMVKLFDDLRKKYKSIERFNIKYHNDKHSGSIGKAGKRDLYKHQNEHRLYLSSKDHSIETERDEKIKEQYLLLNAEKQKVFNPLLSKEERFRAEDACKAIEIKICKLKSTYKRVIDSKSNFTTGPFPLNLLFEIENIADIGIELCSIK